MTLDRFEGCLLGLALGDAMGAPYEGGLIERLLWRFIGTTKQGQMRWTDDTQMSLDIAESIVANKGKLDADDLAARFASNYRWSRGYGPATAKLLKQIARGTDWRKANCSVYAEGSLGNGGAMRAPVIGIVYAYQLEELAKAACLSASITHAHPLGIEGAVLVACATALAFRGESAFDIIKQAAPFCLLDEFRSKLSIAHTWLVSRHEPGSREVIKNLGNKITASRSCVTAVYLGLRFLDRPFLDLQSFIAVCGGDTDTIGAIAGAIWGAANGRARLPVEQLAKLEQSDRLLAIALELCQTSGGVNELEHQPKRKKRGQSHG